MTTEVLGTVTQAASCLEKSRMQSCGGSCETRIRRGKRRVRSSTRASSKIPDCSKRTAARKKEEEEVQMGGFGWRRGKS